MKSYCVIRGRTDSFPEPGIIIYGIGISGEACALIRDFSNEKETENFVLFLNENDVALRHFEDAVIDYLE